MVDEYRFEKLRRNNRCGQLFSQQKRTYNFIIGSLM